MWEIKPEAEAKTLTGIAYPPRWITVTNSPEANISNTIDRYNIQKLDIINNLLTFRDKYHFSKSSCFLNTQS